MRQAALNRCLRYRVSYSYDSVIGIVAGFWPSQDSDITRGTSRCSVEVRLSKKNHLMEPYVAKNKLPPTPGDACARLCCNAVQLLRHTGRYFCDFAVSSALRAEIKSSTQMVACSSLPGPKTPGLTSHMLQCYLLMLSLSCRLVWLQPQSALVALLENWQRHRSDIFTTGWIHPCHVVSGMSTRMDALLLWAPSDTPAPTWELGWPCCRSTEISSRAKFSLLMWISVKTAVKNVFLSFFSILSIKICKLQCWCLLQKEK